MNKFRLAMLPLLALGALAVAGETFDVKGGFIGSGVFFNGELSHFGKYSAQFHSNVKTEVLVNEHGDTLFATTSNFKSGPHQNGVTPYSEHWHFIAGTGKFAGATGDADVSGVGFENGVFVGTVKGNLTLSKDP